MLIKHNNEYIYSVLTDICLAYGGAFLRGTPDTDNSRKLWNEMCGTVNPVENLSTGIQILCQNVETGMKEFPAWTAAMVTEPEPVLGLHDFSTGILFNSIQKMDAVDNDLCAAFISFDHLVLLNVAFSKFTPLQAVQFRSLKKQISILHDELGEKFQQEGWKLIPLNTGRKNCLKRIPEKYAYLFPWYEEWNDVPPESFDLLVEAMAGQAIDEKIISKEQLIMLQVEVENDRNFLSLIAQQAVLAKEIPLAFQEIFSLESVQSEEAVNSPQQGTSTQTVNNWKQQIYVFFSSFTIPRFAGAAAMACLIVLLVTVYRPDQQSMVPEMASFQLYGMTLHTNRGGEEKISRFEIQSGEDLSPDDYFQIHFSLEQDGFVAVLQQSNQGRIYLRFSGKVSAKEEVILPSATQAFSLDPKAHIEKIYLLVSAEKIDNIEEILPTLKGNWSEKLNNYFPEAKVKMFMFQH